MGAVQRLATVVIIGLVALATILVLYLADEPNRIKAEQQEQQDTAVTRGIDLYVTNCLPCHGPGGEGFLTPGEQGTGRIGAPLGGNTYATQLNQEGVQNGTPYPGGMKARTQYIHDTIVNGKPGTKMPAWGDQLNDSQINDIVTMIEHVDWNRVYNTAIATDGGYPTPPPGATQAPAAAEATQAPAGGGQASGSTANEVTVIMGKPTEFAFDPSEFTIPANTDVTIHLKNEGSTTHDFSIDALKIAHSLEVGQSADITINAPAGDYEYYCNVPGHKEGGMVGTLHVTAGGGGGQAAAPAAETPAAAAPASTTEGQASGGGQAANTVNVVMGKPTEFAF
ncbi:MAG TPA: cupredoxin domain-containing protein, partial [Thermomicrobiales bacterium]|nr:cupredoxin domain-containing protein [Thermomicrobiales bacterium]